MGIAERKEREKEEMRELILQAASHVFLARGFEKTSIRNIADRIEYSPATIYLYFKDKNEIMYELHKGGFEKMLQEFIPLRSIMDPFARLVEMGHHYIKFAIENKELYDLMFLMEAPMETLACKEGGWDEGEKTIDMLIRLVQECRDAGYFKKETDHQTAALTIWSYVHGLVTIYLKNRMQVFEDGDDLERMQKSYVLFIEMIRSGI